MNTDLHKTDIASFLKENFSARAKSNPRFSLRSYAKKLGLSPGTLSMILSRKKKLSVSRAHELAKVLGLNEGETQYFILLAEIESARNTAHRSALLSQLQHSFPEKLSSVQNLELENFKLISEWYGLAILQWIAAHPDSKWSSAKIARFFGITNAEVEETLERLIRLELIEKSESGYHSDPDRLFISSTTPNEALRNYYKSLIPKILESIDAQSPKEKVIGTEVFAFDPTQLNDARTLTNEYLDRLQTLAQKGKDRKHVYQAFTNFFRITEQKEKA